MAFVPQDPTHVCGTSLNTKKRTEITSFKTFNEAVSAIRSALGVKFSDYYNLSEYNVFVEGPTDREIYQWVLAKIPKSDAPLRHIRKEKFEDFGGVKHLSGFFRATYQFIRKEYPCVSVFDIDSAGEKERRALQEYFGQNIIPFEANKHFVSVRSRFAIEGLFLDEWIITIHDENQGWFDNYSVDSSGQLEPFQIKTGRKNNVQKKLVAMAEEENDLLWAKRFHGVFDVIDSALKALDDEFATV